MSVLPRQQNIPTEPSVTAPQNGLATPPVDARRGRVPRTRTAAAWLGICTAAVILVVLIVFMLQNTGSVAITFLWMHGNVPLALALLTAGVGVAITAMAVGEARIGQLRRAARRHR
jgi:uncharacterized integral membrane protein